MAAHRNDLQQQPRWLLRMLGEEIQARREQAGLTQEELGKFTLTSRKAIGSYEQGVVLPPLAFIELAERTMGNTGSIRRMYRRLTDDRHADWFAAVAAMEAAAREIRHFEAQLIPGLLQTEAYARAMLAIHQPPQPQHVLETQLALRMERAKIFAQNAPPLVWFVLDEAAFHRWPKNPSDRRAQLDHLLAVASLPSVTLQVMPFAAGLHNATFGLMTYMTFDEAEDCAYVEPFGGGSVITEAPKLATIRHSYDLLRAEALSPTATREFILELMEDQ